MSDHHKKRKFLNLPKYPGGSSAFKEFISQRLQYPAKALEARIEGSVIVEYDIGDNGIVEHPRILKGIGHGCDEEALRVVGLLEFEKVRNRGVRVRMTTKTTIHFRLPAGGFTISYSVAEEKTTPGAEQTKPEAPKPVTYEYTITF
jgi:TonB family protein